MLQKVAHRRWQCAIARQRPPMLASGGTFARRYSKSSLLVVHLHTARACCPTHVLLTTVQPECFLLLLLLHTPPPTGRPHKRFQHLEADNRLLNADNIQIKADNHMM